MFYAYIYHDGETPIYVGKGKNERAYSHLKGAKNPVLKNKLAKMKREGRYPQIELIPALDEDHAFFLEACLIEVIGRKDLGLGTLLNLTDGGEGSTGAIRSAETRAKLAATKLGKPGHRGNLGKKHTEETKALWSTQRLGKSKSAETKTKMSKPKSCEHAAAISAAQQVKPNAGKPCTVDGAVVYPSRAALGRALGFDSGGTRHPNFRYVEMK